MRSRTILAILVGCLASIALAQTRSPTDADIERAKQQYRPPTDAEIDAARKRYRAPGQAELDRAASAQSPVNIDAIPTPKGSIDVEGLARAYEAHRQALGQPRSYSAGQPTLLVFVTLAMPDETLRRLSEQASRSQAVLVLRGLKDASLRQTAARVQQLIEEIPQFTECDKVTGDDCLIARLHVRSIAEMDEIIDRIGDKAETNTAIVKAQTLKRRLPPL